MRKRDDDLERAVSEPGRDHRAETADEREHRIVAGDRARLAHVAGHPDRASAGDLDGGNRLAPTAADVDELLEVGSPQDGLRPVEAKPALAIGETTEDVENRSPLSRAEPPDSNPGVVLLGCRMCWDDHAPMVAARTPA